MNYILLYFIFFILLLAGVYWLFKKIIKTILIVSTLFFILTAILAYATYLDVQEFSQRFPNEQNAFLLMEDDIILTGITFNINQKDNFKLLSEQELNQDIKELLKTNFKVITINTQILERNLPEEIMVNEQASIPKAQFIAAIKSEDPLSDMDLKVLFKDKFLNLPEEITNEDLKVLLESQELDINGLNLKDKSHIRALLLASSMQSVTSKDPITLLAEFKKGNIKIYKETITFKIIKSIPNSLIKLITQKIPQSL